MPTAGAAARTLIGLGLKVARVWRAQGWRAVLRKGSRTILRRLGDEPAGPPGPPTPPAPRSVPAPGAGIQALRDLPELASAPAAGRAVARGPVDPVVLSAIECLGRPLEAPRDPVLEAVLRDDGVSEVVKAYFWRVFEATPPARRRPAWPRSRVAASPEALARDALSLVFLYHLFSFRTPVIEWTRPEPEASLVIRDDEIGLLTVGGDGVQTLTFRFPEGGTVVRRNLGAAVRHRSLDFLTAGPPPAGPSPIGPMFSVVIPVYDRTTELMEAVGSVLNQEYPWCEVVLVFNGSPRETLALVPAIRRLVKTRRYRDQVLVLPRAFGAANVPRNIGAFAASGDFIVFLDSDDALEAPSFLSRAAERVRTADDACCLFYPGTVEFVNIDRDHPIQGRLVAARPPVCDWDVLYRQGNVLNNSGVCVSRHRFLAIGGINPALEYCEDYELFLRAVGKTGHGVPVPATVRIKLHSQNNEIRFEDDKLAWHVKARELATAFVEGREARRG